MLFLAAFNIHYAGEYPSINTDNITIYRDSFGVAHVYAKTDAEAAYGFAWVNSEDAFELMQIPILISKKLMGRVYGAEGAIADYFAHAIGAREYVEQNFDDELSPEFKIYLDGFVQGTNAYAESHPDEVLHKKLFPITSHDVMVAYMVSASFLNGAADPIQQIFDGTIADPERYAKGSNAFAFSPGKTEDGNTYLTINPHFAVEGQFTFYEAHIASEEGLNFSGVSFQGGTSFAMGNNEDLGYGMTWNYFDRVDVFKLKMHPKKRYKYEVDGEYFDLVPRPVVLKVKVGFMTLPIRKITYWSGFGPVIPGKDETYYAIRFPSNMNMGIAEQLFQMNKASDLSSFKEALRIQGLMMFNIVYADKEGNIFYISNGTVPDRPEGFDFSGTLEGDTSAIIWSSLIPVDSLPQVENPSCGYVLNCNNSPFHATCEGENDNFRTLPLSINERPGDNNRSNRLFEQISEQDKVSFEEMKAMKFDTRFTENSVLWESLLGLRTIDTDEYPELREIHKVLTDWDRNASLDSEGATVFALVLRYIFDKNFYTDDVFVFGFPQSQAEYIEALFYAKDWLETNYSSVHVEFGEIHRIKRLEKDYPLPGFPDALAAAYGKEEEGTGKFYPEYGDSYTHFVSFSKEGPVRMETLTPFGASFKEESVHFNDQMDLFVNREMKVMSLDEEYWKQHAECQYHPGEERPIK